ncbi:MAG: hypothetical protein ACR2RB_16995 [Gammaproteobacteria bacterium]
MAEDLRNTLINIYAAVRGLFGERARQPDVSVVDTVSSLTVDVERLVITVGDDQTWNAERAAKNWRQDWQDLGQQEWLELEHDLGLRYLAEVLCVFAVKVGSQCELAEGHVWELALWLAAEMTGVHLGDSRAQNLWLGQVVRDCMEGFPDDGEDRRRWLGARGQMAVDVVIYYLRLRDELRTRYRSIA